MRNKRCCFTGHRPEKLNISEQAAKMLLQKHIYSAIDRGYTSFITGMARGTDIWAAEIILEEKKHLPLSLICAVPYPDFGLKRSFYERSRYNNIIHNADFIQYICSRYIYSCFQLRNTWMVDHSGLVIAAYSGIPGGTKNTIHYAVSKGIRVDNILAD